MKKMKNYSEFLNESKLELILEANIKFTTEFIDLIDKITSPISSKLLGLDGQEVDVNRNYITYDINHDDSIFFVPDDKAEKCDSKIGDTRYTYDGLAERAFNKKTYDIKNIGKPVSYQNVEVVKKLTQDDIKKIYLDDPNDAPKLTQEYNLDITHIRFIKNDKEYEAFYKTSEISKDISKMKKSDAKVGRFVSNFLTKAGVEFTKTELDDFIDKYKSEIKEKREKFTRFEIVKGEDIRHWYNVNFYYKVSGTLGTSCMRYERCQPYLDIYVENDTVSLIILKSKEDNNLIIGRALLWDATLLSKEEPIKFMDRIYINDHSDTDFFIKFAKENGYYYKQNQDYSETPIVFNGNVLEDRDSYIKVKVGGPYEYYPYIDTIKYYIEGEYLTNKDDSCDYSLTDTEGGDGSCQYCHGRGDMECTECEGSGEIECDECYNGSNQCDSCSGQGNYDCNNCEGDGTVDCDTCDGSGTDDEDEECSDCDGSGKKECSDCNGEGDIECSDCDGEGNIDCDYCGGSGSRDCWRCEGDGTCPCNEC
jgi:hypothetical protein